MKRGEALSVLGILAGVASLVVYYFVNRKAAAAVPAASAGNWSGALSSSPASPQVIYVGGAPTASTPDANGLTPTPAATPQVIVAPNPDNETTFHIQTDSTYHANQVPGLPAGVSAQAIVPYSVLSPPDKAAADKLLQSQPPDPALAKTNPTAYALAVLGGPAQNTFTPPPPATAPAPVSPPAAWGFQLINGRYQFGPKPA